jgi:hypothetical protein
VFKTINILLICRVFVLFVYQFIFSLFFECVFILLFLKMSSSGGNLVHRANDNGYLDGIISQITTQSEVTLNVNFDYSEVTARKKNLRDMPERTLPGAEIPENHYVLPGELVFTWTTKQGRNSIPGNASVSGWTAMNGVKYAGLGGDEETQGRVRFVGLAKTPYFWDKSDQPKHGFAVIAFGTGTTHHTGEREFFPGDDVMFSVIQSPMKPGVNQPIENGVYGDYGPGTRVGNPRSGTSRSKMRVRINPGRVENMRPCFNPVLAAFRKPRREGGISDVPFEHLTTPARDGSPKLTVVQEHAMYLAASTVVSLVAGLEFLGSASDDTRAALTRFTVAAPADSERAARQIELVNKIGVFETVPAKRDLLNRLMDTLYLMHPSNLAYSRAELNKVKALFPVDAGKIRETTASRYCQIRLGMANAQTLGYARAVHFFQRARIGTATSYSKPGQRLDLLVNPRLSVF